MVLTANGKRVGRPRNPPAPKRPEHYERPEYAHRVQAIMDALEISAVTEDVRLYLQRIIWRSDRLNAIDAKRFSTTGEQQITLPLRVIVETTNGAAALTLPILKTVSVCLRPAWIARGLALLEAFDQIDLVGLHATLTELGIVDQFDRALYAKLSAILGPPVTAVTKPKAKPAKKSPASGRKRSRPRESAPPMRRAA